MAISLLFCIKEYSKAGPGEYYKLFTYSYENAITSPGPVRACEQTGNRHIYIYICIYMAVSRLLWVPNVEGTTLSVYMYFLI